MKFIVENWEIITVTISGIVSFIIGRKTRKTEEKSGELQNIEKIREIEKQLLLDMEEQISKLIENNNKLESIVESQSKQIRAYEVKFGLIEKRT